MSKKVELDNYLEKFKARKRTRNYIIVGVVAALLVWVYMMSQKSAGTDSLSKQWTLAEVNRGDLSISITEKGTLHPENESLIIPRETRTTVSKASV